ncbi:hypothetical protein Dimus_002597, partial [Dionaea muscipula]
MRPWPARGVSNSPESHLWMESAIWVLDFLASSFTSAEREHSTATTRKAQASSQQQIW